jgi:hypothetical protein
MVNLIGSIPINPTNDGEICLHCSLTIEYFWWRSPITARDGAVVKVGVGMTLGEKPVLVRVQPPPPTSRGPIDQSDVREVPMEYRRSRRVGAVCKTVVKSLIGSNPIYSTTKLISYKYHFGVAQWSCNKLLTCVMGVRISPPEPGDE